MKNVYCSNFKICFGSRAELEQINCPITESIDQTKLRTFSESTKQIGIICDDNEFDFQKKLATFEVVEAAGGVVTNPQGDILMIFRNGHWDLPKGKLETDERIEECALREVQEECNIDGLTLGEFRTHSYHIYAIGDKYVLKRCWWWNMSHSGMGELKPQQEEGITDVKWITPEQMSHCLSNTYHTIRDVIENN